VPTYAYKAINEMGRAVRGTILADNEIDLESRLKQVKLDLIDASIADNKRSWRGGKIKINHLIVLCMHMEQLDRAGVPLHDALADVRDTSDSEKMRDILTDVHESVRNGNPLSKALSAYPKVFNNVFVGLIASGEKTGNLSEAFLHLADHLKWTADIHRKIKKATRYPMVLLCVITLVISVLMVFVVPKLIDFLMAQGFELPIHTKALIAVSWAFRNYWYLIIGTPVVLIFSIMMLYRVSDYWAYKIDAITLKIPLIGVVARKIDMSRFSHFFAVMFNSGIDILESLEGAKNVVKNRVLKEAITMVKSNVTDGNSLTESLRVSNQFPNLVVRMFKVGEDSGNIKEALENINFFYTQEVNDSVETMVGAIQPILTVVMGTLIFWVIAAVFGPLYESFSKMKF
jgi:type IV pilus assembly protein PilC